MSETFGHPAAAPLEIPHSSLNVHPSNRARGSRLTPEDGGRGVLREHHGACHLRTLVIVGAGVLAVHRRSAHFTNRMFGVASGSAAQGDDLLSGVYNGSDDISFTLAPWAM